MSRATANKERGEVGGKSCAIGEQVSLRRWLERKSGGSSIFLAGCIRTAYRGGAFQALSPLLPLPRILSSSPPSPPPSKASGFEISNAVAEILLSFQSFLADAERMRSLPKVGRGQRGMPRRVFGTKVVFPRHGRVWPASKFRMSFL